MREEKTDFELENYDKELEMEKEVLFGGSEELLAKIKDGTVIPEYHFDTE